MPICMFLLIAGATGVLTSDNRGPLLRLWKRVWWHDGVPWWIVENTKVDAYSLRFVVVE